MSVLYKYSAGVLFCGLATGLAMGCFSAAATVNGNPTPPAVEAGASNLPCDVQAVLATNCQSCHSQPPVGGAPMALMTWDDLVAPSITDPNKSNAQLSVDRMQAAKNPMPPQGGAAAADIQTLQDWINAGAKKGACGTEVEAGADPYATDPICTSGKTNSLNNTGPAMGPGENCMDSQCHGDQTWQLAFAFAGTVYPTAHEPDDCVGSSGALSVTVTDKNGKTATAKVIPQAGKSLGTAGNFYFFTTDRFGTKQLEPGPMSNIVVNGPNGTRAMSQTAPSGACNECHVQNPMPPSPYASQGFKSVAPGRIMAP